MLNTKQIVEAAVKDGATLVDNVVIEDISVSKVTDDTKGVDYWVSLRLNKAVTVMRQVDAEWKEQQAVNIMVSNIGFIAMLREAFMRDKQLVPLVRFIKAVDADCKDIATARKAGDEGATTPLFDLIMSAKVKLVCRKVAKDTKVKSLFSLNEKLSDVKNDSYWYDPYDLSITRANEVSYDFIIDANGMPQTVTEPILVAVLKRYVLRAKADEARRAAAKANGGFATQMSAKASNANDAANNLPED